MKLLLVCHRMDRTGAPLALLRLAKGLARRHEVHLLAPRIPIERRALQADYEAAGIAVVERIGMADYDVALMNTILAAPLVLKCRGRVPTLWWIHEPHTGLALMRAGHAAPDAFAAATRIVFPTRWQVDTLYASYLGDTPWSVVPYGVNVDRAPQPPPFQRRPGELVLVQVGTVQARKGHDVTFRALERLRDVNVRVLCLGSLDQSAEFVARLRRHLAADAGIGGRMILLGSQPEAVVNAHLQHADALLFPTRDDLITLAILEAMLFGTCVLASDFGPIPEAVRDGETGLTFPVGDPDGCAAAIRRLAADPALGPRLGAAGRALSDVRFSYEAHLAAMERELAAAAGVAQRGGPSLEGREHA